MRPIVALPLVLGVVVAAGLSACGGSNTSSGFGNGPGSSSSGGGSSGSNGSSGSGGGGNSSSGGGGSSGSFGDAGPMADSSGGGDGGEMVKTIVYSHSDTTLYSIDPTSNPPMPTLIGAFSGAGTITDLAVNANGDVYVNSETALYKATLPSGGTGSVALTQVPNVTFTAMYALAFAPAAADSLDANSEILVGGDGSGTVWSIDPTAGTTKNLGNFGADPSNSCTGGSGCVLGVSGDLVFYTDSNGKTTGLVTIRSCDATGKGCSDDWLAGVDMGALKTAYTSGTPATTGHALLGGVYGSPGGGTSLGPGTGFHSVYGLAAFNSKIFGFTRVGYTGSPPPQLITIDTMSGQGTLVSSSASLFTTKGWSGAGVSTKVTIVAPPPPPPPVQ